jgi:small neutral amino acid transporter SnatA (MarC family)
MKMLLVGREKVIEHAVNKEKCRTLSAIERREIQYRSNVVFVYLAFPLMVGPKL